MGNDARRKQRQKLKRQKKRTTLRRAAGPSPYSKLKQAGEIEACYINEGWQQDGMASILVLRALPGGGHALGAFLVDFMCIGLKDAWGRIDISKSEFRETLHGASGRLTMVRIPPEQAWELVAGGVRWARENGFRLPPRYERWASMLGDLADCATADVSCFGTEDGGLVYTGLLEDLRKRLIGCTLEQFLSREDVEIVSPDLLDDDSEDTDEDWPEGAEQEELTELAQTDEEIQAMLSSLGTKMLDAVRKYLFSRSIPPHPRLKEAVDMLLESVIQAPGADFEKEDDLDDEHVEAAGENLGRFLEMESPESRAELQAATDQLSEYMRQFDSPEEALENLGLEGLFEE